MTMDDRRKMTRLPKKLTVLFGQDEPKYPGFTRNISDHGLEIAGTTTFYPNTVINIIIQTPEPISLKGVVRWISDIQIVPNSNIKQFMGVSLIEAPANYAALVKQRAKHFSDKRTEPRFGKNFKAIFNTPEQLMEEFTQDISKGGIFVLTEIPPDIGTFVSMQIVITETGQIIDAEGEVVHVVTSAEAEERGTNPGIGVQFTNFIGTGKETLESYIKSFKVRMAE